MALVYSCYTTSYVSLKDDNYNFRKFSEKELIQEIRKMIRVRTTNNNTRKIYRKNR